MESIALAMSIGYWERRHALRPSTLWRRQRLLERHSQLVLGILSFRESHIAPLEGIEDLEARLSR